MVVSYVEENKLKIEWILETHIHADHLSAAPYLRQRVGGKIGIGARIDQVEPLFNRILSVEANPRSSAESFDHLFEDSEKFLVGSIEAKAIHTPGHTPACLTYLIGDAAFVGDTIFMPDSGTARCDFPGGDAHQLYQSIRKILALPGETRLFLCHDYGPNGRPYAWETTVDEERKSNIHINDKVDEDAFVAMRRKRDSGFSAPTLILPSVQVNLHAGELPHPERNGIRYLKIPLDAL